MSRQEMIQALTVAFDKSKNSCVKITLCNYVGTLSSLSEDEYNEVKDFYLDVLNRWG